MMNKIPMIGFKLANNIINMINEDTIPTGVFNATDKGASKDRSNIINIANKTPITFSKLIKFKLFFLIKRAIYIYINIKIDSNINII